jgi:hypothetical protein
LLEFTNAFCLLLGTFMKEEGLGDRKSMIFAYAGKNFSSQAIPEGL